MTDPHDPPALDELTVELRLDRKDGPPAGYILHRYVDTVTGEVEEIWNSRPGPVPVQVMSPAGNPASLERPALDRHWTGNRNYVPKVGARVIVDITPQRARQLAEERIAAVERGGDTPLGSRREWMHANFNSREEAVADAANYFMQGGCMLLTVTNGWLDGLDRERAERAASEPALKPEPKERVQHLTREMLDAMDSRLIAQLKAAIDRVGGRGREVGFRFRGLDGEDINMQQWQHAHLTSPHAIVRASKLYSDDAVELHAVAAWSGVDPGDGKIFEHALIVTFEYGVLKTGNTDDDRTMRTLAWTRSMSDAERAHDKLSESIQSKVADGHLEDIVTSTVMAHVSVNDSNALGDEVADPVAFRRFIQKLKDSGDRRTARPPKRGGGKAS